MGQVIANEEDQDITSSAREQTRKSGRSLTYRGLSLFAIQPREDKRISLDTQVLGGGGLEVLKTCECLEYEICEEYASCYGGRHKDTGTSADSMMSHL